MAALALFSTDFASLEAATEWVYEVVEDADPRTGQMRHPFVGCLPDIERFTSKNIPYLDDDLESGSLDSVKICYICSFSRSRHRELNEFGEGLPVEDVAQDIILLRKISNAHQPAESEN